MLGTRVPRLPRIKYILMDWGTAGIQPGEYTTSNGGDVVGPTIWSHNGGADAITTAAVPYSDRTQSEPYSSHGPVTYYFGPVVGTTPAPALGSPLLLQKPELAATDGGTNSFFGTRIGRYWRFYGTSAAAPHAAAVAALMLSRNPALTRDEILAKLGRPPTR